MLLCKGFHNSSVCETRKIQKISGNAQSTNLVNNKTFVLLQRADVILFKDFNQKEARIKSLFDRGSQRSYVSKRVQNILSPEIISKERIETNAFNNNSSKKEISDYAKPCHFFFRSLSLPCHFLCHVTFSGMPFSLPCHFLCYVTFSAMSFSLPCHFLCHVIFSAMSLSLPCHFLCHVIFSVKTKKGNKSIKKFCILRF